MAKGESVQMDGRRFVMTIATTIVSALLISGFGAYLGTVIALTEIKSNIHVLQEWRKEVDARHKEADRQKLEELNAIKRKYEDENYNNNPKKKEKVP